MELDSPLSYLAFFSIAAALGGVGGFVFELLQTRGGYGDNAGKIELPHFYGKKNGKALFLDLGWIASVVVGAVTAMAVFYFFPPELTIDAEGQVTTSVSVLQLVALSLISGSAGGSFLGAMQTRVLANVREKEKEKIKVTAEERVERISAVAEVKVEQAVRSEVESLRKSLEQMIREAYQTPPEPDATGNPAAQNSGHAPLTLAKLNLDLGDILNRAADEAKRSVRSSMQEEVSDAREKLSAADLSNSPNG
ncbi:MAG: hypothetical protein ACRDSJ_07150 [Rubrobacteraceae bacterium]